MKGGVKKINPTKEGFTPVMDMLTKGTISLLTATSLKGFMIQLNVPTNASEFKAVDSSGRFTLPVISYILKIVVIQNKGKMSLPRLLLNGKYYIKSCETSDSLIEESKTQQNIWEGSILGGKEEICPPIVNTSFFTNEKMNDLLALLLSKSEEGTDLRSVLNYIMENSNRNIGIITMPMIEGSYTLSQFIRSGATAEIIKDAKISVLIKVIRLFLQGYIHLDLHTNNSLVLVNNRMHTWLIDFGKVFVLDLTTVQGVHLDSLRSVLEQYLFPSRQTRSTVPPTDTNYSDIILQILQAIEGIDHSHNLTMHNLDYSQMKWAIPFLHDKDVALFIYREINAMKDIDKLSANSIKRLKRDHLLPNSLPTQLQPLVPGTPGTPTEPDQIYFSGVTESYSGGRGIMRKRKTRKRKPRKLRLTRVRF